MEEFEGHDANDEGADADSGASNDGRVLPLLLLRLVGFTHCCLGGLHRCSAFGNERLNGLDLLSLGRLFWRQRFVS